MRIDGGPVAVQSEQIGFFCRLRKGFFRMDDIAPALHLANFACSLLSCLDAHLLLPRGKRHLVNFYLAGGFPDHEVRHIGVRFFLGISEDKLYRLTSVLLDRWVTVEEEG